jgi:hypothetical protein
VTGVSLGTAVITASVEGKSGTVPITVAPAGPNCTGVTPLSLAVGEVRQLTGSERGSLCVPGGASGAEFALIPVDVSEARASATIALVSSNTTAALGPPTVASAQTADAAARQAGPLPLVTSLEAVAGRMPRNRGFEARLRAHGRELTRTARLFAPPGTAAARAAARTAIRARAATRTLRAGSGATPVGGPPVLLKDLPPNPGVGTLVTLNANSTSACTVPTNRTGRVAAVTSAAIAIVDTAAPAGGFTDAEYLSIATTFDTLIYPLDTTAFGPPFDMDANGRVAMFFTTAVNQLTAAGATSVINGFFFERDLFRRDTVPGLACATSNEGEMFYLPVVDPNSQFNPFFRNKSTLLVEINATTVHEFQHLINASRRIWVTPEIVETEENWLNEGMSHLAEEMLYLRVAGLGLKQDLGFTVTTSPADRLAAMNAYGVDNLFNFNTYLGSTESNSPYAANDDLVTRGAGTAFLRYSLDQSPNAPSSYLKALVDAPTQGIPNYNRTFPHLGGLGGAVRAAAVANFADNTSVPVATTYQYLTWNFRDWLPHFTANSGRYPLTTRSLVSGSPLNITLAAGGSSVVRFRVPGGATGGVGITLGGAAGAAAIELMLVRTQ